MEVMSEIMPGIPEIPDKLVNGNGTLDASSQPPSDADMKSSVHNGEIKNGHHEKKHKEKHKDKKHKHHKHEKDRDRDRHSTKDKDHKSSSDKHKSEDKLKIKSEASSSSSKEAGKEKESSSSSSSKHKSKHKDKNRDKDRERNKEKEKEKNRDSKSPEKTKALSPEKSRIPMMEVKPEPVSPVKSLSMTLPFAKIEGDESDDDVPLAMRANISPKKERKPSVSESEDEDDIPLAARQKAKVENGTKKRKVETDSDDDVPLSQRQANKKIKSDPVKKEKKVAVKKRARSESESESEYDSDYSDKVRNKKKARGSSSRKSNTSTSSKSKAKSSPRKSTSSQNSSPTKKKVKEEEEEVWEWWKEAPREDGVKWNFLEHKGPVFAPDYEPLPKDVKFRYNGKSLRLSAPAEEVAGFYSRFIEHDYTTKEMFNKNFFKDWRRVMTAEEKETITDLKKCDFREINEYYKKKAEERKAMSKEEKLKIKEENESLLKTYGICILDGHKEKIGNFRIEPPGLFRGRGEHPKMGMLKTRVMPEDVIINCSKDAAAPTPPKGHKWKEVRHDNTVSWLACWTENVQGQPKYVMLNPSSRLKGEKDWMKYEKARELAKKIDKIRENYKNDFKSKEMRIRQRAVAMYFIDKLALRAGNEKDEDQADTVGCCSLRFEHIKLHEEKDGKENVVVFDFLGKDSIRYYNEVPIDKRVFKNLKIFMQNKKSGDDLFDRLNTAILNKHLGDLMDGLSAKVFRTYNASHTLQEQLDELTPKKGTVAEKVLAYNRANRAVAILCNHQRAAPKSHEKSMENLEAKITSKKLELKDAKKELKGMKKGTKDYEKKENAVKRLQDALAKMEMNKTDKEEGKEIALGTSKLNYLDPRITVAWCKKYDVPIEKAYNKTQRSKFRWAIDMADKTFRFD